MLILVALFGVAGSTWINMLWRFLWSEFEVWHRAAPDPVPRESAPVLLAPAQRQPLAMGVIPGESAMGPVASASSAPAVLGKRGTHWVIRCDPWRDAGRWKIRCRTLRGVFRVAGRSCSSHRRAFFVGFPADHSPWK